MTRDAQGHQLTGGTADAARHFDDAVRAATLSYGNPLAHLEKAIEAAPGCAMAHLARAWVLAGANDAALIPGARAALEAARKLPMNEREGMHAAALEHAMLGHRASATRILVS